jgi:hypothetical protein
VIFTRFHRHKNLEDAILSQAKEVSDLKLQLASIYGKIAVSAREKKKETVGKQLDAEVRAIQRQLGGDILAVQNQDGTLEEID